MEDGRTPELRRMMVEYGEHFWRSGWAPLYGVLGETRWPPCRLCTSRHPSRPRTCSPRPARGRRARMDLRGTLGVALVYLGEHYVVDLAAGLALAEGVRPAPGRRAARAPAVGHGAVDRGAGARMTDATAPRRVGQPRAAEDATTRLPPRGSSSRGRNLLVLGGFIAASLAALYYLLPQLAGLKDTWHRIEDGSPYWMFLALCSRSGCSPAT